MATWWLVLIVAGLLEAVWVVGLRYSEGFTRLWPTVVTLAAMGASMGLLAVAVKHLPIGTAYAVWTGIGAIATVVLGMALFAEPRTAWRLAFIACILIGVIGLRVAP